MRIPCSGASFPQQRVLGVDFSWVKGTVEIWLLHLNNPLGLRGFLGLEQPLAAEFGQDIPESWTGLGGKGH